MILDKMKKKLDTESCDEACKLKIQNTIKQYENILKKLPSQELIDTGWFDNCEIMPDCYSNNYAKEKTFTFSKDGSVKSP